MILPVWQNLYQSSHRLAQEVGERRGEIATHTGTLDPMAEGVLVVLTGEDRYKKGTFQDWTKDYSFSILWGLQTDSGDRLGLITRTEMRKRELIRITAICENFPSQYDQKVPDFSARRWEGGAAFDQAKLGIDLPTKTRTVSISELRCTGVEEISLSDIMTQHSQSVNKVQGEFRQAHILENWHQTLASLPPETMCLISSHTVTTSVGTYIRQLTQDIAAEVGVVATTWRITRTRNGDLTQDACVALP